MTYKLPSTWSPQQTAFIDWAKNGRGSAVLEAVAGSGKTTTILGAVTQMRGPTVILAYNKKIAQEIEAKLLDLGVDWKQARAGTVHSFGFTALRKYAGNIIVKEKKVEMIFDSLYPNLADQGFAPLVCKLVSLGKQRAIGAVCPTRDRAAWADIVSHFDLLDDEFDPRHLNTVIEMAIKTLTASNANLTICDFDDMVYLPLVLPCKPFRFNAIFLDEAQDTNPARRELVKRLLVPGGRLIAVGDPAQAIYGFTGADNDSLDLIVRDFDARRMPLTVSYRCPKAVVAFARQWVNHITAAETAITGEIGATMFGDLFKPEPTSAILCRNTAPLVKAAFSLIRRRIPCKIEGRDIGKQLIKLASKWSNAKTIDAYEEKLTDWIEGRRKVVEGVKLETLEDQYATVKCVIDQCLREKLTLRSDMVEMIESLFADNVQGVVTLSTIHRSKGREWETVYWLNRAVTCPSKYAKQAWESQQEVHLQYVAATRSQNKLIDLVMGVVKED